MERQNYRGLKRITVFGMVAASFFTIAAIDKDHKADVAAKQAKAAKPVIELYSQKYDKLQAERQPNLQPREVVLGLGQAQYSENEHVSHDELANRNKLLAGAAAEIAIAGAAFLLYKRREHQSIDVQTPSPIAA